MKIRIALLFPALLVIIVLLGLACSAGKSSPLLPQADENSGEVRIAHEASDAFVGGLWEVGIDKSGGNVQVTKLRSADKALNVLGFMEPPVMFYLSIDQPTMIINPDSGQVSARVILNHPLFTSSGKFDGFDVRGVVFGPELLNADGYTPLLRPKDFSDVPFGYIDGMLGSPDDWVHFDDDVNPYKYFTDNLGPETDLQEFFSDPVNILQRGIFSEGATNLRRYDLSFNVTDRQFLIFNYAVLVSYDFPTGDPPYTLGDFPIETANCAEPFHVAPNLVSNNLYYNPATRLGGYVSVDVEVYDWQGLDNIEVTMEIPDVTQPITVTNHIQGSTIKSGIYPFVGIMGTPQGPGPATMIVTAVDTGTTFGESYFLDLLPESHPLYNSPVYTEARLNLDIGTQPLPLVSEVLGPIFVPVGEENTYSVDVVSTLYPDGLFTYNWEAGDDHPAQYDDGPGNEDGTIDLIFYDPGVHLLDCRVTDPDGNIASSIKPLPVFSVNIPDQPGNLTLSVNRYSSYAILDEYNIRLSWDMVGGANEYVVYADTTPMDSDFNPVTQVGTAIQPPLDITLAPDSAAYYVVRARGLQGLVKSESLSSNGAFVDLEQAESDISQGHWGGNSIYDNSDLQVQQSSNPAYRLSGEYGWYDALGSASSYQNSYEVFCSDQYPEVVGAGTFRFEVAHKVYNYSQSTNAEDGYSMGYMAYNNLTFGLGPGNFQYYIVLDPASGPAYEADNDAQRDEFTYANNPDAGYTGTSPWRLSIFDASMLQWDQYDRLAVGHATDTQTSNNAYLALDDIAVIIY